MFVGHYGAAFVARAAAPRLPLWLLLLAAQAVDLLFLALVAVGVERVALDPSLPSNPLDLQHMPISHGLLATAVWSAGVFAVSRSAAGLDRRSAAVLAAVVGSHWGLDFIVHRPDLPLVFGEPRLGLALWNHPLPAFLLEEAWLLASLVVSLRWVAPSPRTRRRAILLVLGLAALQAASGMMAPPASVPVFLVSMGAVLLLVPGLGRAVESAQPRSRQTA